MQWCGVLCSLLAEFIAMLLWGIMYVLLANVCTDVNMRLEAGEVRMRRKVMGMDKTSGCSSIEMDGVVYEFMARNKSHPECREIYTCLSQLLRYAYHFP